MDPFDPVAAGHIAFCRSMFHHYGLRRILLVLSDPAGFDPCASRSDRWRMLVAACGGSSELIPVDPLRQPCLSLQQMYPEDELVGLALPLNVQKVLCPSVLEYCSAMGLYGYNPRIPNAQMYIPKLFDSLSAHRFAHSLAVADTARVLAARFGADQDLAEETGLLHDCAKCMPNRDMKRLAVKNHLTDNSRVLNSGALLHSIVGAFLARTEYGVTNREILLAIEYHNTGCAGMSRLAMCVCLADYIEPNRELFPGLEEARDLAEISLEKSLLFSLKTTADHVRSKGKYLHPRTLDAIDWLESLPAVKNCPD